MKRFWKFLAIPALVLALALAFGMSSMAAAPSADGSLLLAARDGAVQATDVVLGTRLYSFEKAAPAKPPKVVATAATGNPVHPTFDRRLAVVCGINNYPGTGSDLNGCVADAQSMETTLLTTYGFDAVTRLEDSAVTREGIADAVSALKPTASDELFFFYSGHGSKGRANDGDSNRTDHAIVIWKPLVDPKVEEFDFLWDEELRLMFVNVPSLVVFAFDSCYSGGLTVLGGENRIVVGACGANQLSYELLIDGDVRGAFTYLFSDQAMYAGYANVKPVDAYVTVEEAYDYTKAHSSDYSNQVPVISDGFTNDLVP